MFIGQCLLSIVHPSIHPSLHCLMSVCLTVCLSCPCPYLEFFVQVAKNGLADGSTDLFIGWCADAEQMLCSFVLYDSRLWNESVFLQSKQLILHKYYTTFHTLFFSHLVDSH